MNRQVFGTVLSVILAGNCVCMAADGDNPESEEWDLPSVSVNVVDQSSDTAANAENDTAPMSTAGTTAEITETELPTEEDEISAEASVSEDDGISLLSVADDWESVGSINNARADFYAFVLDDGIYIVGGFNSTGYVSSIEKYSAESDEWQNVTEIADMPKGFAAAGNGDKIYIAGGYRDGEWINETRAYDTTTGEWSDLPGMTEKRDQAAALYLDNKLYVFGGRNELGIVNSYEYYDFDTETWSEVTTGYASSLIRIGARVKYINGYLLMYGGVDENYEYCGSAIYSISDLRQTQEITSYQNKSIAVACGAEKVLILSDTATELTIDSGQINIAGIDMTRDSLTYEEYVIYNGYLYRIGGYQSDGYRNQVEKYRTYFGDYATSDGAIADLATVYGNALTLSVEEGKEYMLFINVSNMSTFDGYAFTVEYPESSFTVSDACAMTTPKDTQTGAIGGTDINVTATSDDGLTFECTEEIADGNSVTETVNAVLLKAQTSGQVTIKYAMVQE